MAGLLAAGHLRVAVPWGVDQQGGHRLARAERKQIKGLRAPWRAAGEGQPAPFSPEAFAVMLAQNGAAVEISRALTEANRAKDMVRGLDTSARKIGEFSRTM